MSALLFDSPDPDDEVEVSPKSSLALAVPIAVGGGLTDIVEGQTDSPSEKGLDGAIKF